MGLNATLGSTGWTVELDPNASGMAGVTSDGDLALPVPGGPVRKLIQSLEYAYANETFQLVGDSTGNESTEWFYLMMDRIVQELPSNTNVSYRLYNDAQGRYDAKSVIQVGDGEPYVTVGADLRGWGVSRSYVGAVGGADLDVWVDVQLDSYTTGNQVLMAQYGGAVPRNVFYFYLNSAGAPQLFWSTDGGTTTFTVGASTNVTGLVSAGGRLAIRATLDVDNGAGSRVIQFFTSTDTVTWTQLGTTTTTAGTTSIYNNTTQPIEIGSRNASDGASTGGAVSGAIGRFYGAHLSTAISGPNQLPAHIREWGPFNNMNGVKGGGPALVVYNGSISGQNMAYFNTGDRLARMIPRTYGGYLFINSSHNEGTGWEPAIFKAGVDAFVTACKVRAVDPYVIVNAQNPQTSPRTAVQIDGQARRNEAWRMMALANNWKCIDAMKLDWTGRIDTDGVHPIKPATIWGNEAFYEMCR